MSFQCEKNSLKTSVYAQKKHYNCPKYDFAHKKTCVFNKLKINYLQQKRTKNGQIFAKTLRCNVCF